MKQHKTVWLPRTCFPVYIGFCPSEKAWKDTMKRMKLKGVSYPTSHGHTALFETPDDKNCAIVTICHQEVEAHLIMGLLCHEASHVVDWIFDVCSERHPGGETRAYLMQYVFQELMDAYAKTRGGK